MNRMRRLAFASLFAVTFPLTFLPTDPVVAGTPQSTGAAGASPASTIAPPDSAPPFQFGAYERTLVGLNDPMDVAIGPDRRIYVLDRNNHRVAIFAPDGVSTEAVGFFGRFGGGEGEFRSPEGIAIGKDGFLFVADSGNHRVQVFDASGGFVRQWGDHGAKRSQFNRPADIAVDDSWVYVADTGNDRVQVFDRSGGFITILGGPGAASGDLRRPGAVAVDCDNLILIADTDHNRLVVFDKAGRFLRHWGDFGPFAGMMDQPLGVDVAGGNVFVADTRNHRIQIFDTGGAMLREWGNHARLPREGEGRLHYPRRIAIAPDRSFAVICEPFEDRCQVFRATAPGEKETPRSPLPPDEQSHFGKRLAIDGPLLAIPEPELHGVYVFDLRPPTPILITRFGERGPRFGQFMRITGAAVDAANGRIAVADSALGRIQSFELDWDRDGEVKFRPFMARFVRSLRGSIKPGPFARAAWPMDLENMRRDAQGRIHVIDPRNRMVFVYDSSWSPLMSYGGAAAGPGELLEPTDAAVSRGRDLLFVTDAGRCQVVVFDQRGRPFSAFGTRGTGPGQFIRPEGIAAGRDGFVYVTDAGSNKVMMFTEAGTFVAEWGTRGGADGEFWKPAGIEHDSLGRLVVLDPGNHRAQIFSTDGSWLVSFGSGKVSTRENPAVPGPPPAIREE